MGGDWVMCRRRGTEYGLRTSACGAFMAVVHAEEEVEGGTRERVN